MLLNAERLHQSALTGLNLIEHDFIIYFYLNILEISFQE